MICKIFNQWINWKFYIWKMHRPALKTKNSIMHICNSERHYMRRMCNVRRFDRGPHVLSPSLSYVKYCRQFYRLESNNIKFNFLRLKMNASNRYWIYLHFISCCARVVCMLRKLKQNLMKRSNVLQCLCTLHNLQMLTIFSCSVREKMALWILQLNQTPMVVSIE